MRKFGVIRSANGGPDMPEGGKSGYPGAMTRDRKKTHIPSPAKKGASNHSASLISFAIRRFFLALGQDNHSKKGDTRDRRMKGTGIQMNHLSTMSILIPGNVTKVTKSTGKEYARDAVAPPRIFPMRASTVVSPLPSRPQPYHYTNYPPPCKGESAPKSASLR